MFKINGHWWRLIFVPADASYLMRYDGSYTIGMTDLNTKTIYISNAISGDLLHKVFKHELSHAYCLEYGIYLPLYYEEVFCDALATYGEAILDTSNILCQECGKC